MTNSNAQLTHIIELAKDEHACKGVCTIANEFGIPNQYRTITNRAQGYWSATKFAKEQQKVTVAEVILVNFILESMEQGFPMTHKQIEEYANLILWNRIGLEYKPVGEDWVIKWQQVNRAWNSHSVKSCCFGHKMASHIASTLTLNRNIFRVVKKFILMPNILYEPSMYSK